MRKLIVMLTVLAVLLSAAVPAFAADSRGKPGKVKITEMKLPREEDIRIYWKKVKGVSGYQLYRKKEDAKTWKLYKSVSGKYNYATDTLTFDDKYYDWEYKVRAYKVVGGKKVYGSFFNPVSFTSDWTAEDLYSELWQYGESLQWTEYEFVEGSENPDYWDKELWPTARTYSLTHITGEYTFNDRDYQYVYTNSENGAIKPPRGSLYQKNSPQNSSWGVRWPLAVSKYQTQKSAVSKLKKKLESDMKAQVRANPQYWDTYYEAVDGTDAFTVYYEAYKDTYRFYLLF